MAERKGEAFSELRKTLGVLRNYMHNNYVNPVTYNIGPTTSGGAAAPFSATENTKGILCTHTENSPYSFFVAAYGFEGFAKTAAESGINVSDHALPVTMELTRTAMVDTGGAVTDTEIRYDIFAQTDMIIYLTADGQLSTQV